MRLARSVAETRGAVAEMRGRGAEIAFVPTMGALHAGHRSLVERGRAGGRAVVASVFVNPLQFGPGEDFETYPRDLDADRELARHWGVELVFAPPAEELLLPDRSVTVDPGPPGDTLEGRTRPGHFRGVLTIVTKLFNIVRPDVGVFGQKDLQQAVLVGRMVRDLDFAVRIEVCPTVREADGLALSSRNAYLSPAERARAPALFRALRTGEAAIRSGEREPDRVREEVLRVLRGVPGLAPDYVAVRRAQDLAEVGEIAERTAILGAARLGRVRLIDNLIVDPEEDGG